MTRMTSTTTMIGHLEGLLGTKDVSEREASFIQTMVRRRDAGEVTALSDKQVEWLNDLHSKHFVG